MDPSPSPSDTVGGEVVDLDRGARRSLQLTFVPAGPVPAASWFAAWEASTTASPSTTPRCSRPCATWTCPPANRRA